ncbi:transcriptional regulator GcvA [Arenibaculum pallidiluteum]|uniref:transcriptional regulator GcvA n=1 Tax=Arenibaculum pallidiluteum TaxID=2812559 RepID=UPI001A95EA02|nr:transcriptional regulator GcvA [Arenibaculum pallidiluteum]
MGRRLPPLNAVRAFEAAARHLSFTRAAAELNVTQAAISHQIKGLEETLGVPLFRRLNRALVLTEAGQSYLPPLNEALDLIAEATARLRQAENQGVLTVSTISSFAARWLVPRLPRFQALHPTVDVRLSSSTRLVDFTQQDVDIAIRFGRGHWPDLAVERLLREDVFPVATPALRDGPPPIRHPSDLRGVTLLHDDFTINWADWLRLSGVDGVDVSRGPRYTDSGHLIQAALAGQGVALARSALIADDLAAGRLVRLFDLALPSELAYWVVCPPHYLRRPKVRAFRDWLFAEAARTD